MMGPVVGAPLWGRGAEVSSILHRNDEVGSWSLESTDPLFRCQEEQGLEESRCAECVLPCPVAILSLTASSSETRGKNTVHCSVAFVIVLLDTNIGSNGVSYHHHCRQVKKQ